MTADDISNAWGFHILQALRGFEDRVAARFASLDAKIDALNTKFDSVTTRIDTLGSDLRREISGLRYWTWGAILTVLIASPTLILRNPHL
jgi:hypothetical protein